MKNKTKVAKSILMHKPDSNVYIVCYKGEAKEKIKVMSESNPCVFADLEEESETRIIDSIIQVASEWDNLLSSGLSDQQDMNLFVHVNNATPSIVEELKVNTSCSICSVDSSLLNQNASAQDIKDVIKAKFNLHVF